MVDWAKGENPTALPAAGFLISLDLALPLTGGLGEAAHLVSPNNGVACGVTGLVRIGKGSLCDSAFWD